MSDILATIVARKKQEVAARKAQKAITQLVQSPYYDRKVFSLKESILSSPFGIIAEFKRKSPSKGIINDTAKPEEVTKGYVYAGASGVSVLTDIDFFGGSDADLLAVRQAIQAPILRKEFIIDEYQLYEAKAIGADAILLIAAAIEAKTLKSFAKTAKLLGMEVLLEVHNEQELEESLNEHTDIVGVNNRSLKTFEVSLENSVRLSSLIPKEFVKISESGVSQTADIRYLQNYGFNGFLIGENFMKTTNPKAACLSFFDKLKAGE
jgi:indole-3-glycerol phosphate synthase